MSTAWPWFNADSRNFGCVPPAGGFCVQWTFPGKVVRIHALSSVPPSLHVERLLVAGVFDMLPVAGVEPPPDGRILFPAFTVPAGFDVRLTVRNTSNRNCWLSSIRLEGDTVMERL